MKKTKLVLVLVAILISFHSFCQFSPQEAQKSLVKVLVVKSGESASVLSGFIWKKGEWIVTSLHGMKESANINVQYLNKDWRNAKIIKIYKEADLVLLEVDKTKVPAGVVPVKDYSSKTISFGEDIIAIGYNSNSKGSSTRTLKKGYVNPETLEHLVPEKDRNRLSKAGIPSIDLDIIYLDGSLLPGYSGSPVYNKSGSLVGIGDGGLEGGSSNVSWIIPAKFLQQLEASNISTLPADFARLTTHFSAEAQVDLPQADKSIPSDQDLSFDEIEDIFAETYTTYNYGGFEFYYTKTRTFSEMYETAYDAENITEFVEEFENMNLHVDYDMLAFDIYEDANNGIILALPEGQDLEYSEENDMFFANLTDFPQSAYFSMLFEGTKESEELSSKEDIIFSLLENINTSLGQNVGGFTLDEDYTYSVDVDDDKSIVYMLTQSNIPIPNADGTNGVFILYITLLIDSQKAFYSIAVLNTPVEVIEYASTNGINCIDNYDANPELCDYFESYMQLMCAVHLTTFANKQIIVKK